MTDRKQSWAHLREVALYKAGYKCSKCSSEKDPEVHHLFYPAKNFDDVIVLCRECHRSLHGSKAERSKKETYLSIYIPDYQVELIEGFDRLAEETGKPRNKIIVQLLKAVIEAISKEK